MSQFFVLGLAVVTSALAYVLAVRVFGASPRTLAGAALEALELLGMSAVFLALNLAVGLFVVLGTRTLTPAFISVYLLNDDTLLAISLLQGLVFGAWRSNLRRP